MPKINILKKPDVWQQFDQEIRPKLDCVLKISELAALANKNADEIANLVSAFLKKGKTQIPSWFFKQHGLEPSFPQTDPSEADSAGISVTQMRLLAEAKEKEQLLTSIMELPVFSEINKNEASRTIRILSKYSLATLKDVFEKLSGDFKSEDLNDLLKSYAASYSAKQPASETESAPPQKSTSRQTQHMPFRLDYSQIESELQKHFDKFRTKIDSFFKNRSSIQDLKSANVKSITCSKAFEYRTEGKHRVYFVIEDHTIKFVRIGDKTSQKRDVADMIHMYPK